MDLQCLDGTLIDPTQNVEDKLWVNFANISVKFLSYLKLVAKDSQVFKLSFCESHANDFPTFFGLSQPILCRVPFSH